MDILPGEASQAKTYSVVPENSFLSSELPPVAMLHHFIADSLTVGVQSALFLPG